MVLGVPDAPWRRPFVSSSGWDCRVGSWGDKDVPFGWGVQSEGRGGRYLEAIGAGGHARYSRAVDRDSEMRTQVPRGTVPADFRHDLLTDLI